MKTNDYYKQKDFEIEYTSYRFSKRMLNLENFENVYYIIDHFGFFEYKVPKKLLDNKEFNDFIKNCNIITINGVSCFQ